MLSSSKTLEKIGRFVRSRFDSLPYAMGYAGRLFFSSFFFFVKEKTAYKILIMQLLFTFIEALPLIVIMAAAIGSGLYIIGYNFLMSINQANLIYRILVIVIMQELGPLLVAFVVTARSATAIATELAGMVVSHQIESYVSFGIDPIGHLAAPRFLGVTLSLFFLNLYFSFCGLLSPAIVAQFVNPAAARGFFTGIFSNITVSGILLSSAKSLIFGMVISIIATYFGFNVERASTEIPVAGLQAVGKSVFGVILADALIIAISAFF